MHAVDVPIAQAGPEVMVTGRDGLARKCTLFGLEQGKMYVRSDHWIDPESRVGLQFGHLILSGIVKYSIRKDGHYSSCVDLTPGEDERREPRLTIQSKVHVTTLGDERVPGASGIILDLAVSGMRLNIPYEVAPGAVIFVEMESDLVAGEVRRCTKKSDGSYEAGVAITDVLSSRGTGARHGSVLRKVRTRMAHALLGKGMEQPANVL